MKLKHYSTSACPRKSLVSSERRDSEGVDSTVGVELWQTTSRMRRWGMQRIACRAVANRHVAAQNGRSQVGALVGNREVFRRRNQRPDRQLESRCRGDVRLLCGRGDWARNAVSITKMQLLTRAGDRSFASDRPEIEHVVIVEPVHAAKLLQVYQCVYDRVSNS